jgi:hypothetical protein
VEFAIDAATNTNYWKMLLTLRTKIVDEAFQDLEANEIVPVGHHFIKYHMICDVKIVSLKDR